MSNLTELAEEAEVLMAIILSFHYEAGCIDSSLALCLNRLKDSMGIVIWEIEQLTTEQPDDK